MKSQYIGNRMFAMYRALQEKFVLCVLLCEPGTSFDAELKVIE